MIRTVKTDPKRKYNTALRHELAQLTRQRIIDAARRLLVSGSYSSVTMDDIAREAGVAYQTVYSVFGTKLALAHAMIESELRVEGLDQLMTEARETPDPEVGMRIGAQIARGFNEPCADLIRFMRESGDPDLVKRYHEMEARRLDAVSFVPPTLVRSGRLRPSVSTSEARDMIWAMSGPDPYIQLVFQRGWSPSRYEEWLGDALISMLLEPEASRGRLHVGRGVEAEADADPHPR
jgi:AcrR family transcriptional regulator